MMIFNNFGKICDSEEIFKSSECFSYLSTDVFNVWGILQGFGTFTT